MRPLLYTLGLSLVLPWLGIWIAGKPLSRYLEFPPQTLYIDHAGFSWWVFIGMAVGIAFVVLPFLVKCFKAPSAARVGNGRWPWWGWLGLLLMAVFWILAWNRFTWFAPFQKHTFFPLWFGYIVTVNAITQWRTGKCLMISSPSRFLWFFPFSAVFWWSFEWLNRFVQNWEYQGVEDFSPLGYFLFASLAFSTVLPAVAGTREMLASFPGLTSAFKNAVRLPWMTQPAASSGLMILGSGGLLLVGIFPSVLYPLLWLAPLFLLVSLKSFRKEDSLTDEVGRGKWSEPIAWAAAALICGFFWEMWNLQSEAKWIYHVPYVGAVRVFEMPLLGYAGYLPFGILCGEVVRSTKKMR